MPLPVFFFHLNCSLAMKKPLLLPTTIQFLLTVLFCVLSFVQPVTLLTSKMEVNYLENARTVHAGSWPRGKWQHPQGKVGFAETRQPAAQQHGASARGETTTSRADTQSRSVKCLELPRSCLHRPRLDHVETLTCCSFSEAKEVEAPIPPLCFHTLRCSVLPRVQDFSQFLFFHFGRTRH